MDRCDACDLAYDDIALGRIPTILREHPPAYRAALERAEAAGVARIRPDPDRWSALEYACHVRDVLRVQRDRITLAQEVDQPVFASMRRDERAVEERYNEQDSELVLQRLEAGARRLADTLDQLTADQWGRTGEYQSPSPAQRPMSWVARHTVHELVHHLADIEENFARLGAEGRAAPGAPADPGAAVSPGPGTAH